MHLAPVKPSFNHLTANFADADYQFVEGEYMKAEEYDELIYDPSDFIIRKYWPRAYGKRRATMHTLPLPSGAWQGSWV